MPETMTIAEYAELIKAKPKQHRASPESDLIQIPFFDILRLNEKKYPFLGGIFHAANGERRDKATGAKLKRNGVIAGCWDVCIPFARQGFNMFFLEFKFAENKLSKSQVGFRRIFDGEHIFWEVHWSPETALKSVEWYFNIKLQR